MMSQWPDTNRRRGVRMTWNRNRLTEKLGIDYPIIQGPLGGLSSQRLTVVWMTAVVLSHIFVLGYGWFFVDALMVMLLAVIYLLLTRRHSHWGEPESVGTTAALQTHKK